MTDASFPVPTRSVGDRLERLPFSRYHRNLILAIIGGEFAEELMLGGNGTILAVMAVVLHFNNVTASYVVPGAFFAGEFVGSIVSGYVADRLGRKAVFLYDLLIFGVFTTAAGFFSQPWELGLFIFLGGLGCGGEFAVGDSYVTELTPKANRGKFIAAIYTVVVLSGPLLAVFMYGLSHPAATQWTFRIPLWCMGVLGILVWIARLRLLESPRWLESRGKHQLADEITTKIEQRILHERHLTDLPEMNEPPTPPTPTNAVRYRELFSRTYRGRTIAMIIYQFLQGGIVYGFGSLAPVFLLDKGYDLVSSLFFSIFIKLGSFAGGLITSTFVDRVERKWGIIGAAVLTGIFGTSFALADNTVLVVMFGFLTSLSSYIFAIFTHAYQAEIYPTRLRATGVGTCYSVSRISTAILVPIIASVFLPHGLPTVFGFIWFLVLIVAIVIGFFGPRTHGLTVEQIADEADRRTAPRPNPAAKVH